MNLMNLFNLKYLIQNFKKSKALIILLILLVPMFTSILLLSVEGDYAISFAELSIVNIIFMYIIPVVLSMSLFNYVYKKNSVDFVGSMPLSRKTIFVTNTIGGIAIIAIMQLITMISTLFLSKVLSGVIIFGSMVWDIFVFFTIAYIFVFTVSNLAMSFSGNKFSQLVAICLIIFLIPFITMSGDLLGDDYSYVSIEDSFTNFSSGNGEKLRIEEPYYFTAPNYIFDMVVNDFEYEYSTQSVIKMIILSIIYIIIGLIIFNKKKLEMAGESYENVNIHLLIKMLTFIPFMFVFCSLNSNDRISVLLFFVAILAVYYFVFDLITNKKVKLKLSIPAFIISAIIIFAVYEGIVPKFGRDNDKIINVDDIQSVSIDSVNTRYNSITDFGLLIEDKELIDLILAEANEEVRSSYYYDVEPTVTSEIKIQKVDENTGYNKYKGSNASLTLNMKNGNEYSYNTYLSSKVYEAVLQKFGKEISNVNIEKATPILEGLYLSDIEKNEIIDILNKELNNLTYENLYLIYSSDRTEYTLYLYEYVNHKLVRTNFSVKGFRQLNEKMMNMCNNKTVELIDKTWRYSIYEDGGILELVKSKNPELFSGDNIEEYQKFDEGTIYDIIRNSADEIENFIREDIKNPVKNSMDYIVLRSYYPTFFYTNNIEKIYMIIAEECNNNEEYNFKLNTNL